ncbi:MAG: hypothetical protein M3001_11875 [Staphylococcus epidermidis]|nr:hypothetical protein [Staphylococcus epidermidis]
MLKEIVINISITVAIILFGVFISGDLNTHADSNNSAVVQYGGGNNHGQVTFFDRDTNKTIKTISYDSGIHDMSEEIQHLKDAGYDVDNIPNSYDFSGQDVTYNLSQYDSQNNNNNNIEVRVFDHDGNRIETKYIPRDDASFAGYDLEQQLSQEGYAPDNSSALALDYMNSNSNIIDVYTEAATHLLSLNYVDQNGKIVYIEKHAVSNFGTTDALKYLSDNYTINDNQRFISNTNTDFTVKVTAKQGVDDSNQQKENDFVDYVPVVNYVSSPNDMSTYMGNSYKYNANISFQDQTGKIIKSVVLSDNYHSIVSMFNFLGETDWLDYDISGVPNYIDLSKGNHIFTINDITVGKGDNGENNKPIGNNNKIVFRIIDQAGRFVEYKSFNTNGNDFKVSELEKSLSNEHMIFASPGLYVNGYIPAGTFNMDIPVIIPNKVAKVNYVNQDNQLIFSSYHIVSSEDEIYLEPDIEKLPSGVVIDDYKYINAPNIPEQTIYVTENLRETPYKRLDDIVPKTYSEDYPISKNNFKYLSSYQSSISSEGYAAVVILKNQYGKIVKADALSSYDNNLVRLDLSDEIRADFDTSSLPKYVDLSLGNQTFVIKSLKPDDSQPLQIRNNQQNPENSNQTVSSSENNHNFNAQSNHIKPTQKKLKNITMFLNKEIRSVNNDTSKLKMLRKKKHLNKKQKAAYKALQTKLASDKKAVKSYKSQEGKLTKYFKEVAVINRDNKQIKSLKAQMKKLKKSHSKASKKKYAKAAKALKKANSSLKAATKFVNNYK